MGPERTPTARRHFDPVGGWFRGLERRASYALSRWIFPRVPGITLPYAAILGRRLTVRETEVRLASLPPALDGIRVLLVTDVHAGPFLAAEALARAFGRLRETLPDVVVHGGDLATTRFEEILPHGPAVESLRGSIATLGVLGNHDHYTRRGADVARWLEDHGVRMLVNDAALVERDGARIAFAGIDDWNVGRPDVAAAMGAARRLAPESPAVLVSHNPDGAPTAAAAGARLVLSGHTHGGQVRVPGLPVLVRMSRYRFDEGLHRAGGAAIVVSRGLGVSGVPIRLGVAPEADLVTLRTAP